MSYNYPKEKLSEAITILATYPNDVRSRLLVAYKRMMTLEERDFPVELQSDWNWIHKQLTKYTPKDKYEIEYLGSLGLTLKKIKNSTGTKIAHKILELYRKLSDY